MSDSQLERMADFFDRRCSLYDEVHTAGIDGGAESKRVLAGFLPAATRTLLDLGIGTGLELEGLYARFPALEVTGLDISGSMLERLREKYPDKAVRLRRESYMTADLGREAYDAALSVMSLHHYAPPVKTALYRRIRDCLKPGGVYLECDYMLDEEAAGSPEEAARLEAFFFAEYARLKREQGLDEGEEYHYDTPCTVGRQTAMLKAAGFTRVERVWSRKNTVTLLARTAPPDGRPGAKKPGR